MEKELSKVISRAKKDYYFLNFSDENWVLITNKLCKILKEEKTESKIYSILENLLNKYIKLELESGNILIIENYINHTLTKKETVKANLEEIDKLITFLDNINYQLTDTTIDTLINYNKTITSILKFIVTKNIKLIEENKIEKITDNLITQNLILNYCDINSIKIEEKIETLEKVTTPYTENSLSIYFYDISNLDCNILTAEEERYIINQINQGNINAKNKLIESNLKLVISIAKKYQNRGLSLQDLIQEGNIGLIKAVEKYNINKGAKFSTYAAPSIRRSMINALAYKGRTIRLPMNKEIEIIKLNEAVKYLTTQLGREPTEEEIGEELNIKEEKIAELIQIKQGAVSLNTKIDEEENSELGDFIESKDFTLEEKEEIKNLQEILIDLIDTSLNEREKEVLNLRYGLDGNEPKTLQETGDILKITKQRAGQLELRALRKIRKNKNIKYFIEDYAQNPSAVKTFIEEDLKKEQEDNLKKSKRKMKTK